MSLSSGYNSNQAQHIVVIFVNKDNDSLINDHKMHIFFMFMKKNSFFYKYSFFRVINPTFTIVILRVIHTLVHKRLNFALVPILAKKQPTTQLRKNPLQYIQLMLSSAYRHNWQALKKGLDLCTGHT